MRKSFMILLLGLAITLTGCVTPIEQSVDRIYLEISLRDPFGNLLDQPATIALTGQKNQMVVVEHGVAKFRNLTPGVYIVSIESVGYDREVWELSINQSHSLGLVLTTSFMIDLDRCLYADTIDEYMRYIEFDYRLDYIIEDTGEIIWSGDYWQVRQNIVDNWNNEYPFDPEFSRSLIFVDGNTAVLTGKETYRKSEEYFRKGTDAIWRSYYEKWIFPNKKAFEEWQNWINS